MAEERSHQRLKKIAHKCNQVLLFCCIRARRKIKACNNGVEMSNNKLDSKVLENWLWDAACIIRGPIDAPKYKDYILPLIFFKRLSDVFEDELSRLSQDYLSQGYNSSREVVEALLVEDHKLVRFYLPQDARWGVVASHTTNVGEQLTDAIRSIARENPKL